MGIAGVELGVREELSPAGPWSGSTSVSVWTDLRARAANLQFVGSRGAGAEEANKPGPARSFRSSREVIGDSPRRGWGTKGTGH